MWDMLGIRGLMLTQTFITFYWGFEGPFRCKQGKDKKKRKSLVEWKHHAVHKICISPRWINLCSLHFFKGLIGFPGLQGQPGMIFFVCLFLCKQKKYSKKCQVYPLVCVWKWHEHKVLKQCHPWYCILGNDESERQAGSIIDIHCARVSSQNYALWNKLNNNKKSKCTCSLNYLLK